MATAASKSLQSTQSTQEGLLPGYNAEQAIEACLLLFKQSLCQPLGLTRYTVAARLDLHDAP